MIIANKSLNDYLDVSVDFNILNICTLDEESDNGLYFINRICSEMDCSVIEESQQKRFFIIIDCNENIKLQKFRNVKLVKNPRLFMLNLLYEVKRSGYKPAYIENAKNQIKKRKHINKNECFVSDSSVIHETVGLEPYCYIGDNVVIGENSIIETGVKISSNTVIGKNCIVRSNTVIGNDGFGIEKDENGNNIRIPHLGGVFIRDNVEIGSFNTVCSGTIAPTELMDYVFIDDHVHVAHNVTIDRNSLIIAGTIIGGSCKIGENVWLGINSSIHQSRIIGNNSIVGMGAVVLKDVENNSVIIGNPGKKLNKDK